MPEALGHPIREVDLGTGYPEEASAPCGVANKTLLVQSRVYRDRHDSNVMHPLSVNTHEEGDTPPRGHPT